MTAVVETVRVVTTDIVPKAVERGSGGLPVIHLVLLIAENNTVNRMEPVLPVHQVTGEKIVKQNAQGIAYKMHVIRTMVYVHGDVIWGDMVPNAKCYVVLGVPQKYVINKVDSALITVPKIG